MTLEEKRIRIGRYCSSIQGCESCVLKKWCDEKKNAKHYFFDMPEDMADNAITILDSTGADLGMFTEDLSAENVTLEEKRDKVHDYCQNTPCSNCVLNNRWIKNDNTDLGQYYFRCRDIDSATETELDKALDLISHPEMYNIDNRKEAVNHPNHYQGPHECIEIMEAMFGREAVKHFCMCNAFKYRFRAEAKNGEEDIRKAQWYEEYLIKMGGIDNDTE